MSELPLSRDWSIRQERDSVVLTRKSAAPYFIPQCWSEPLDAHTPRDRFPERLEIDEATLGALLEAARRIGQAEGAMAAGTLWSHGRKLVLQALRRYNPAA